MKVKYLTDRLVVPVKDEPEQFKMCRYENTYFDTFHDRWSVATYRLKNCGADLSKIYIKSKG